VRRVVNKRVHFRRKFLGFGAIPSVENQEEFAQRTEGGVVKVFSEWSSWGKGFFCDLLWLEKGCHGRASLWEGFLRGGSRRG